MFSTGEEMAITACYSRNWDKYNETCQASKILAGLTENVDLWGHGVPCPHFVSMGKFATGKFTTEKFTTEKFTAEKFAALYSNRISIADLQTLPV